MVYRYITSRTKTKIRGEEYGRYYHDESFSDLQKFPLDNYWYPKWFGYKTHHELIENYDRTSPTVLNSLFKLRKLLKTDVCEVGIRPTEITAKPLQIPILSYQPPALFKDTLMTICFSTKIHFEFVAYRSLEIMTTRHCRQRESFLSNWYPITHHLCYRERSFNITVHICSLNRSGFWDALGTDEGDGESHTKLVAHLAEVVKTSWVKEKQTLAEIEVWPQETSSPTAGILHESKAFVGIGEAS